MYSSSSPSGRNFRQRRSNNSYGYGQRESPSNPYFTQGTTSTSDRNKKSKETRNNASSSSMDTKRKIIAVLGSLLSLAVWYLTPISDQIVELMLMQVPIEADKELARSYAFDKQYPVVHHPKYTVILQSVGWQLVASSRNPTVKHYDWDFAVINDPQMINAFALPGGMVRVTTALLDNLQLTEAEVAALIGHEMGHVIHRHSQARIISQQVLMTIMKALLYQDDDPHQESFGEAVGELMIKSADWLGRQSFSRANEYQADAFSWNLLLESQWYNPEAVKTLLNKLWEYHGRQGGTTSWESTHPGTLDRIGALEEKWDALDSYDQNMLRTKLQ